MQAGAWHFSWHWKRSQCGKTAAQNALLAHGRDAGETLRLAMALAADVRMAAADQPPLKLREGEVNDYLTRMVDRHLRGFVGLSSREQLRRSAIVFESE